MRMKPFIFIVRVKQFNYQYQNFLKDILRMNVPQLVRQKYIKY